MMLTFATEENNNITLRLIFEAWIFVPKKHNIRRLYKLLLGSCVRERRAMILGQKVAAKRLSSSKVRVHQPDKPRTGAEKISGLRFLATEAHPPRQNLGRAGGSKNEVPTTLQDRVDPWTTGRQAPNWPTTQWRDNTRAFKILFRYCLPAFWGTVKPAGIPWAKWNSQISPKSRIAKQEGSVVPSAGLLLNESPQSPATQIGVRQTYSIWTLF